MKERPIIFSGPMVRAILDGRKTQTRRVMKPQPEPIPEDVSRVKPYDDSGYWWPCAGARQMISMHDAPSASPFGFRGDRLWVRQTFADLQGLGFEGDYAFRAECMDDNGKVDADSERCRREFGVKWKPSIHMPRIACRILLEVTSVRVERVQEIDEPDIDAEGVWIPHHNEFDEVICKPGMSRTETKVDYFAELWDSINAKRGYSWESNPWVWVVEFKRIEEGQG